LNLVVLPADDPFGGGRLAPTGRLREPLESLRDASAVILNGAEDGGTQLAGSLRRFGFHGPGFASQVTVDPPRIKPDHPLDPGARVLLVAGIARASRFFRTATELGIDIVGELDFPDHHAYPEASCRQIADAFRETSAEMVLTTSKDHVKLLGKLDLPLAELPIRAEPEPEFWRWLEGSLDSLAGNAAT